MNDYSNMKWTWITALGLITISLCLAFLPNHLSFAVKTLVTVANGTSLSGDNLYNTLLPFNPILQRQDDGVLIYQNSIYQFQLESDKRDTAFVHLIAKGEPVKHLYPFVNFKIYPNTQDGCFITSENWGLYRIPLHLTKGSHLFEMSYLNDAFSYPEDKNLYIKTISIGRLPDSWINYIRNKAPCSVSPGSMSEQKWGDAGKNSFILWNHGILADDVYFTTPGKHMLYIRARRHMPSDKILKLEVRANGTLADTISIQAAGSAIYPLSINAVEGLVRLSLQNTSSGRERRQQDDILIEGIWIDTPPE